MKTWTIPVCWEMFGTIEVEADTLSEAMKIAVEDETIELPDDDYYVDGSFDLGMEEEDNIRDLYNHGELDDVYDVVDELNTCKFMTTLQLHYSTMKSLDNLVVNIIF